ncbi:MAG TPA: polysaccharide biosynthesis tyrosine autokinase [Gemmatimonas sp.]|uniref:polysaccharide biosynthesis tyrosine autokinase n=1 Tax=Gemmatimonas sp. TaxID=1962908 RepID=UPI002ED9F0CE
MSGQQIQPLPLRETAIEPYQEAPPPGDWGGSAEPSQEPKGPSLARYLSAINRFKWLILLITLLGAAGGYAATRFITPEYVVQATILLEQGTAVNSGGQSRGPIQAEELLAASGWQDLLRSFAIADPVVTDLGLFVTPAREADSLAFRSFRVDQMRLAPGNYSLDLTGGRYALSLKPGIEVETGVLGDSIGRTRGFLWQPDANALRGRSSVEFNVQTPREASIGLIKRLDMHLETGSSFLFLNLTGENAQRTAATLNAWVEQFVAVATSLKKKNVSSVAMILEGQREFSARSLQDAETALESFRVRTVTEPTERQAITPGLDMTTSPAFDSYFRDKVLSDNYRRDREALERIAEQGRQGQPITREAVLSIPSVNADPAADNLRKVVEEQSAREFNLRRLRESYTDEYQRVKDELAALATLRSTSVPNALDAYLAQLRLREQSLNATIDQSSKDLRGIPARTIEEQRLKRQVEVAAEMYRNLNLKAAEAKLAEAATIPDVNILDPAVAPLKPTRNTAPMLILGAIAAAFGLGVVLAILLDQVDKRFRYPEQATDDLGLFILGVVPVIDTKAKRRQADQAAQVVEAFRTIRMNVRYAADPHRPLTMTITSPGPNDGKSLISSNLALSFAEGGARTLLIDGDIRRGELAKTFGVNARPGLVEYLDGTALIAEVLHPATSHPNLTVMPGGARRRRAPELLATPRLNQLINQMAKEYDVVIIDSPPLGAGFDAYALATAAGNMALVMRAGITDRKMAAAKMAVVDTLPVRVMGAVLNGIKLTGVYQYYSYYQEYAATDEELPPRLAEGSGPTGPALPRARS